MVLDAASNSDQIDLKNLLAIALRRKWLVILPLFLVTAATFGASYLITPEYKSSTIIEIDPQVPLTRDVQILVGQDARYARQSGSDRRNQLKSFANDLTSLRYMGLLNDRLKLDQDPEIQQIAQASVAIRPSMTLERATLIALQARFKDHITVSWASGDQIELTVSSPSAVLARDMANNLGDILIDEKKKRQLNRIRSSQDFSDRQLERFENQLAEKIDERTTTERELLSEQLSESITSETNRSELTGEIDLVTTEIDQLRRHERSLIGQLGSVDGLATNRLRLEDSPDKTRYENDLNEQLAQIGDLSIKYTWSDPQIINLTVRINDLVRAITRENKTLVAGQFASQGDQTREQLVDLFDTRSNVDYLYSKKAYLETAAEELTAKMNLVPEYEAKISQLDREIEAARDLRDRFRRQQESSTLSQALVEDDTSARYRRVEPAKLALAPFKPDRKQIIVVGFLLGLAIGCAAVILVEVMDNSFKRVTDVERTLGLPVLGVTPKVDFSKRLAR